MRVIPARRTFTRSRNGRQARKVGEPHELVVALPHTAGIAAGRGTSNRRPSRLEEPPPPPRPRPHEQLALVQAVLPVRPELDRRRHEAEARPRRRARDRAPAVAAAKLRPARDEGAAARERGALLGGERRGLARPRPRGPVCVGLGRGDPLDPPLHAYLLSQAVSVENEGPAAAPGPLAGP